MGSSCSGRSDDDDDANVALKELFFTEPLNIRGIASLLPTVNAPLLRDTIINNLDHFGEQYPFDLRKDADYDIDYGGKEIYSNHQTIELLTDYLIDGNFAIGDERIHRLIANIVMEGGIVVGSCAHVRDLLKNVPTMAVNGEIDLSNITAEDILFIQALSSRVTGWSLASFGYAEEGLGVDEDVFVLIRDPDSKAIVQLNKEIKASGVKDCNFAPDISGELFGPLLPSSKEITEMILSKTGKVDDIEVTGYYKGEVKSYDGTMADGKGVMKFSNGDVYDRFWKNGKMCGKGAMHYNDGAFYQGDWKDGNPYVKEVRL